MVIIRDEDREIRRFTRLFTEIGADRNNMGFFINTFDISFASDELKAELMKILKQETS